MITSHGKNDERKIHHAIILYDHSCNYFGSRYREQKM